MDYDWFWVLLALGIFIPAGTVPLAMARDACRWWREQRRERGEREIAGPHLWAADIIPRDALLIERQYGQ